MRVVLSGGGTGGHIYPALAIAQQCRIEKPDTALLYIGSNRGMEKDIVPKENISFEEIEINGFKRSLSFDNINTVIRFLKGTQRCKQLLRKFNPDIVVGTGGYVCGPVLYAAAKLGIPTIIHEQNVIPGLTNRFLSRYATSVAVSFKGSEKNFPKAKHVLYTGNPRATSVKNADPQKGWQSLKLNSGSRLVVLVGGSGGAKAINEAVQQMVEKLHRLADVHFIYVTGPAYYDQAINVLYSLHDKLPENLHIYAYINNMPEVLAAASLIVNRSGASFLAEITALGLPSILIPSPNVTNNHQEANAKWLSNEGAAQLLLERDLNADHLFSSIEKIMNDPVLFETMAKQAIKMGQSNAAILIYNEMLRLCQVKIHK